MRRSYRDMFKGTGLVFFDVCVQQTDLTIGTGRKLYDEALQAVIRCRKEIEAYIRVQPEFLTSYVPVDIHPDAPEIAVRMCKSAKKAGVGPMAAVAGAVSEMVGLELLKYSDEVIIENGGDIFIKTNIPRKVGIFTGESPLNEKIALPIKPEDTPLGVCTSSGTIGHSLSFGKADAAVIISKDTFLADACATAMGNLVKSAEDIEKGLAFAASVEGVSGALVIIGARLGAWGDIRLARM